MRSKPKDMIRKRIDEAREKRLAAGEPLTKQPHSITVKQKSFIKHLCEDGFSPIQAAQAAGYAAPQKDGFLLMRNPRMIPLIEEKRKEWKETVKMTKTKVMEGFLEAIDIARLKADPLSMTQAWKEVAKMCGYYAPVQHKLDVTVNGRVQLDRLQSMSDDELLRLAHDTDDAIEGEYERD